MKSFWYRLGGGLAGFFGWGLSALAVAFVLLVNLLQPLGDDGGYAAAAVSLAVAGGVGVVGFRRDWNKVASKGVAR